MNKGFTLVELLAILFLLSIITIVAVPNIINTNKKSKENDIEEFRKTVENAAEVYVETHQNIIEIQHLKEYNNASYCINLSKLSSLNGVGLLSPNLKDPKSGKKISELNSSVMIIRTGNEIIYTYQEVAC